MYRIPRPRRVFGVLGRLGSLGLAGSLAIAGGAGATVRYVDDDAAPGGNGLDWSGAFVHLDDAVTAANADPSISEIRVAGGRYRPDTSAAVPGGTGDRLDFPQLTRGVTILGGFAGIGAPDPDARDTAATPTILDADLDDDDDPAVPASRNENAAALLRADLADGELLVLDGLVFRDCEGSPVLELPHGAVAVFGGRVTVRDCLFTGNRALSTGGEANALGGGIRSEGAIMEIIDSTFTGNAAVFGAAIYARFALDLTVRGTTIRGNRAGALGGAIRQIFGRDFTLEDSVIEDNSSEVGGALAIRQFSGDFTMRDTRLIGNRSTAGAGGAIIEMEPDSPSRTFLISGCVIEANDSDLTVAGIGLLLAPLDTPARIRDTIFRANTSTSIGGALGVGGAALDLVNCIFVGNRATLFSALKMPAEGGDIINCTFADNSDAAIAPESARIRNSIIWDCGESSLVNEGGGRSCASCVDIEHSIIEGGWPGTGNLDIDPQFVQAGTGDVRLAEGSPAVDFGIDAELPPDVEFDLAGAPRIQGLAVDLGAYEGEFPAGPPASSFPDIDPGQVIAQGLEGPDFDPVNGASFLFVNESDVEDAELLIADLNAGDFPAAPGGTPVGIARAVSTDVPDGELRLLLLLPFDGADLEAAGGPDADPRRMNLARRDEATNAWALAASANTVPTGVPGIETALADRTVQVNTPTIGFSTDFGRWGVWWNEAEQRGVVWATTDRIGTYALVLDDCPADAAQPPNGLVDLDDLLLVLQSFDRGAGPWDVDGDGAVSALDLTGIIAAWGICP